MPSWAFQSECFQENARSMKNTSRKCCEKILREVFITLWRFCVLKKYQNEQLGNGFIRQIHWKEHGFTNAS